MIDDLSRKFDDGEIRQADVEMLLDVVFGDDEQSKSERRRRLFLTDGSIVKFQLVGLNKQAAEIRARQALEPAPKPVIEAVEIDERLLDDVPEFDSDSNRGPDYVPDIKAKLGIIAGVRMFGKPQAKIRAGRTEGIKVRCPFDHHNDLNPSAWVNTDKNTWFCGKCQVGGDVIDFYAAAKHGLQPSDFHRSPQFRAITEEMAEQLGIEVYTPYSTSDWASPLPDEIEEEDEEEHETIDKLEPDLRENDPPVPQSAEADEPITISEDDVVRGIALDPTSSTGTVVQLKTPTLNVSTLPIPEGTFLDNWISEIRKGYPWIPEEYLLFLGLQAVGLAAGHHVVSQTANLPLNGSLLTALIGPSGYGKSTAANFLRDLIKTSGPAPKFDPGTGTGIKEVEAPASAEALVNNVKTMIEDPMNAAGPRIEVPTTGWLFEDELATFISRARRAGGGHLKQYLMRFHDFTKRSDDLEPVFSESALSSGRRVVHDAFLSGTFLTQTQALRTLADNEDLVSGFMNRIVPVFGHQAEPQDPFETYSIVAAPYYKTRFESLWKVCRNGSTMGKPYFLEPEPECRDFYRQHPFFTKAQTMQNEHPIYARLTHITLRIALLFAINEHARDCAHNGTSLGDKKLEVKHLSIAVDVMERLVMPGYVALMEAVLANEVNEYIEAFQEFIRKYYEKHGRHPLKSRTAQAVFNKKFDVSVRRQGLDFMLKSGLVAEVFLTKSTKAGHPHYVVSEGKFRGLTSFSTYKEEDIYDLK